MLFNIEIWIHIISMIIILGFAVIYSLLIIFAPNIYAFIKLFCIIVLIAAIYKGIDKNTYLPFLGYTAIPPSLFTRELVPQGAQTTITVDLPKVDDGCYVVYWAALSSKEKDVIQPDPFEAYGDFSNVGITSVRNHKAVMHFKCPDKYNVGSVFKKTLPQHLHYRIIAPNSAIMTPVQTAFFECNNL